MVLKLRLFIPFIIQTGVFEMAIGLLGYNNLGYEFMSLMLTF
jgi:hypothetical protein